MTQLANRIFSLICRCDGIKAREIARQLHTDYTTVNRLLYCSPFIHDLCYRDANYNWHGYIRQTRPHKGLEDYSGFYATETMVSLFRDLEGQVAYDDWEIVFELRIKRSRAIRISADVLVITEDHVFSLEFKMNDQIEEAEVAQAAKYTEYQEVLFGMDYDVIPVLVLTKATDLYTYVALGESTAELPVCSGDMLFNIFDEYIGFLDGQ